MNRIPLSLPATGLAIALSLLSLTAVADEQPLFRLHGSNTVGEQLAPALVKGWLAQDGFDRVEVTQQADLERIITGIDASGQRLSVQIHAHGSSTSFGDLAAGRADIGMSSRRIRPAEVEQLMALGQLDDPRHEVVLGIDGLAVIVHPDNPITALDIEQIRGIFSGRIRDWQAVGGRPGAITLYARDEKSGTFDSFDSMVMQGDSISDRSRRFESSSELSDLVAGDRNGIGFIGLPYIRQARALAVASGDVQVLPERFSSATEDYPLSRRLYLYVPEGELAGPGGDFARFVVSDAGQRIVDEIGFVGQAIETRALAPPEHAPENYRNFVRGALRASMNFRFERGLPELDSKSQRDLERLVEFLREPANRNYRLMLMGFADPSETMKYFALSLSNDRVDFVASLLLQHDIPVFRVRGFGDSLPLAEATGPASAAKNRRVEVWLMPERG
jgi:phosphate transport system substrate-binding protein